MKKLTLVSFESFPLMQIHLPLFVQGQNSITKPCHDFWHGREGYKMDPEIMVVDRSFTSCSFFCLWIDLNHLSYNSGYFLETCGQ